MAGKEDAVVTVEDEGVVRVDLDASAGEGNEGEKDAGKEASSPQGEPKPEKRKVERRKMELTEEQLGGGDQVDTELLQKNLEAAQKAQEESEKKRAAAEATAAAERAQREAAERQAAQHAQTARSAQEQAYDTQVNLLTSNIESTKGQLDSLQAELSQHYQAGEFDKASATQTKIARAAAALDRLEASKADLEANPPSKNATTEGRVEASNSAFEQYVSQFSPQAQSWLRMHPECVPVQAGGNGQKNAQMMKGHFAALAEGIQEGSPDYYRVIEETVGYRQPVSAAAVTTLAGVEGHENEGGTPPRQQQQRRQTAQPSAPVTRDPPAANGQPRSSREVRLTKDQMEAARMSFPDMTPNQAYATYARNLVELENEGKMGRTTH